MSTAPEYLTTKEVAELLRLKERKIYDLAAEQIIPCTRATGKLLFSRAAIDQWLLENSNSTPAHRAGALITGSHDPLLEWAVRESQCAIATLFDGSIDGLQQFSIGKASVAALHLYSGGDQLWNVPQIAEQSNSTNGVLVNWVYRQRGLVYKPGLNIQSVADTAGHSVAGRQDGAGSQILFNSMLRAANIDETEVNYATTARSESDAVLAVAEGIADCTMGLQSLAVQHQLEFLPLIEEPLDLLIDRRFWFEPSMQKFIEFCQSQVFTDRVARLEGYRLEKPFEVRHIC